MSDSDESAAGLAAAPGPDGLDAPNPAVTPPDGYTPGGPDAAPKDQQAGPAGRLAVIVTALGFVGLALVAGRISSRGTDSATILGATLGTMVGCLAIGVVVRWIYLRATHRVGTIRSPWTLLVATAWLAVVVLRSSSTFAVEPAPDPAAWLGDATPYVLLMPTTDQAAALIPEGHAADVALRQVMDHDTLVGFVTVSAGTGIDADEELTDFASSATGASNQGQRLTLGGHPAILVRSGKQSGIAFVDGTSYFVAIVAADDASVRAIADALIAHAP